MTAEERAAWLQAIRYVVSQHPEMAKNTIQAAVDGVLDSEDHARTISAKLGLALSILVEHPRSVKFRKHAAKTLIETKTMKGAPCEETLRALAEEN